MPAAIPQHPSPAEPRTPERQRQRLAEAIETHRVAADRLKRTRDANEMLWTRAIDATAARERAEQDLATARNEAPAAWVSSLVDGTAPPSLVEDAEAALAKARTHDETIHRTGAAMQDELHHVAQEAETAAVYLRHAVNAVVASSPAVAALLAEYQATRDNLDKLATVLNSLGPLRLPKSGQDWVARPATPDDAHDAALLAAAALWEAAIDTLAVDASAPLPT